MVIPTVGLEPEVESGLEALAEKLHRNRSWIINQALREFLARQDLEQARWQETEQALHSVQEGRVVSEGAVHAWLGSWGTEEELSPPKAD